MRSLSPIYRGERERGRERERERERKREKLSPHYIEKNCEGKRVVQSLLKRRESPSTLPKRGTVPSGERTMTLPNEKIHPLLCEGEGAGAFASKVRWIGAEHLHPNLQPRVSRRIRGIGSCSLEYRSSTPQGCHWDPGHRGRHSTCSRGLRVTRKATFDCEAYKLSPLYREAVSLPL